MRTEKVKKNAYMCNMPAGLLPYMKIERQLKRPQGFLPLYVQVQIQSCNVLGSAYFPSLFLG